MKLGALKREFIKNGGSDETFHLIAKLANTDKVLIDGDSNVVYGTDAEIGEIKKLAPQLFVKPAKGTNQGDNEHTKYNNQETDDDKKKKLLNQRLGTSKDGKNPLIDFYASHGIELKK